MNRTVNFRALLMLAVTIPSFFIGGHYLHAFQMQRGSRDLLARADQAAAEGRPEEERDRLHDYLELKPDDMAVLVRYGRAVKQGAHNREEAQRAYRALTRALELDPNQPDVRREAATLATDLGRYSDAKELAQALMTEFPDDGQIECLLGRNAEARGQYDEAVRWYEAAEKHAPQQEETYLRHAILLRERRRTPEPADDAIRALVSANPASISARLTAARYWIRYGVWEEAERESAFVTGKPGADGADVYLMAATVDEARGRLGPARERVAEGLRKYPGDPALNLAIARLELRAGHRDEGRAALKRVAESADATPGQLAVVGDLFLDLDDSASARAVARRVRAAKGTGAARLDARLRIREGDWGGARVVLERQRTERLSPAEARQVDLLLGSCYEHLDDAEGSLAAYRRALRIDPLWVPACRGEITALLSLGKLDEAEQAYRKAATVAPELNLGLAQLLLTRQFRRPVAERQWTGVEVVLARLPETLAKGPEAARLRAELLSANGKSDEARRLLEAERDRNPKRIEPWLMLAGLARQRGNLKEAAQILESAEAKRGPDPALAITRIVLATRNEPTEARKALTALEPSVEKFKGDDQRRVLNALAEAYFVRGDSARAQTLWRRLVELAPRDLDVRVRLLEMAYRAGDADAMEQQVNELRNLEGPGGGLTAWGEAARNVILAEKGDRTRIAEAHRRLNEAHTSRPRWAPVPLLEARLARLEGDNDRAGDQYVQAVRLGEREPAVIRAAVDGLYRRRRYSEARDLLQDCAAQTLATPDLGRRAAELTLMQAGDEAPARHQALEQARQAVPANSTDPHDYQWLAQVARAAGEPAEAEKLLRKALTLSEKAPDTWLALIQLLAGTDVKKATTALDEARGKLSAEDAPYVLGAGYELVGQPDKAREQYDALLAKSPSDPAALRVVADFYSRRGPAAKAEVCLRRLLDPGVAASAAVRSAARRELAIALAGEGRYAKFREALALLDAAGTSQSREDELTRAVLLASRPEKRKEARALLEKLAKEGPLPSETQFVLAQLLEEDGDKARADELVLSLLGTDGHNPALVSWHVQSLFRRGQYQTARPWLEALQNLEPTSLRTASLTAKAAAKEGRPEEATRLLLDFVRAHPERKLNVAAALEEVGVPAEAEKLFREESKGNRPTSVLALAEFLGRHQHVAEALTLCAEAWKTCPAEIVAASSLSVARAGGAGPAELAALSDQFAAAFAKQPDSIALIQARAELAELRGRFDEALALYQDELKKNPEYVPALNNRAWLLALKGGSGEEALRLIDHVLQLVGPIANYLDTRAVAYLAAGRLAPATADMEEAIRQDPSAPFYFHLADARLRAGDRTAAAAAILEGKNHGLRPEVVHPLERDRCRQLLTELETP